MVEKRGKDSLWFDCTPEELRAQLSWLTDQGAVFVSLADVESALTGGPPLPEHAVAITFADNYKGFLTQAWPILKEEEIPVTMFVHTGHVGSQKGRPKMTWDELRGLEQSGLFHAESQTVSHPADLRSLSREAMAREFRDSKSKLEQELGRPVKHLAYPSGKFNRIAEEEALAAGYTLAFTEEQDPAETAPSRTSVPRYVHTRYREAWQEAREAKP
jgi:peptidoglycan/xylan/chitin deacetylase (PgdA/CDA1 family)